LLRFERYALNGGVRALDPPGVDPFLQIFAMDPLTVIPDDLVVGHAADADKYHMLEIRVGFDNDRVAVFQEGRWVRVIRRVARVVKMLLNVFPSKLISVVELGAKLS